MNTELQPRSDAGQWVSPYTTELMLSVAERVAGGELLTEICREPGMPDRTNVWRWAQRDPEFGKAMAEARAISAHVMEEDAVQAARLLLRGEVSKDQIRAVDVAMTQLRWSAGRRNPQYNDKSPSTPTTIIQINTDLWAEHPGNMQTAEFKVVAGTASEVKNAEG